MEAEPRLPIELQLKIISFTLESAVEEEFTKPEEYKATGMNLARVNSVFLEHTLKTMTRQHHTAELAASLFSFEDWQESATAFRDFIRIDDERGRYQLMLRLGLFNNQMFRIGCVVNDISIALDAVEKFAAKVRSEQ